MKTRIVVHIALNAKGERVGCLVVACGRFISRSVFDAEQFANCSSSKWLQFYNMYSLKHWKKQVKYIFGAVRFQRVILDGVASRNGEISFDEELPF